MIGVALYVLVIGVFVSVGGWLAERILASLSSPRRGAWAAAMLLAVAIPAWRLPGALPDMSPVQVSAPPAVQVPMRAPPAASRARQAPAAANTAPARGARTGSASHAASRLWTATVYHGVLRLFIAGWCVASALLLARLLAGAVALRRRVRRWETTVLDGVAVTVSDDLGPAVLGIVRPRIIVPRWLLGETAPTRSAVLTHESEHLRAHDAYLLLAGWLLIALTPWNLPLWWLWRRLRLAIEVDCDARVVRRGLPPASYGEQLLAIATRVPASPRPAIGLFERRSQLARRIRILVSPSRHWWRWAALPLYAFTALAALAAGTFPAPPIDAALGAGNQSRQTAHEIAAMRAQDARATRRLLASGQPDALAAAAILGWPYPDAMRIIHGRFVMRKAPPNAAQRLAWLSRAVSDAPQRAGLVMLEKDYCQAWNPRCDIAALDARLRALDPDNGLGWLDELETSVKAGDPSRIDAALAAIGRTRRVDVYGTHLFAHLVEALHGIGGEDFVSASGQIDGVRDGTMWLDATLAFARVCNWKARALAVPRLSLCRKAVLAFERGDSFLMAGTGTEIAVRLWPAGTPEHRRAVIRLRRRAYLNEQAERLLWPPGGWQRLELILDPRGYFERMDARYARTDARYAREQDALRADLIDVGLRVSPPPGWKAPQN